jgi:hypothetical protein
MTQISRQFQAWFGGAVAQNDFGAKDRIECPKCGSYMYVLRRMPNGSHCERQTLECLKCGRAQLRTVDDDGQPIK